MSTEVERYKPKYKEKEEIIQKYGVVKLSLNNFLYELVDTWLVDPLKIYEDEEKKKIPLLYEFYNEVVSQYWNLCEFGTKEEVFAYDGKKVKVSDSDDLKEDLKNLVVLCYTIKDINKDLLDGYVDNKLVYIEGDSKKVKISTKQGLIREDQLKKFLRIIHTQISTLERREFMWGLKPPNKNIIETEKEEDIEYYIQAPGAEKEPELDEEDIFAEEENLEDIKQKKKPKII